MRALTTGRHKGLGDEHEPILTAVYYLLLILGLTLLAPLTQGIAYASERQLQLVSPLVNEGASIGAIGGERLIQAAASGDAITYVAEVPTERQAQGAALGVQVLSTREADGWTSRDISLPHNESTGPEAGRGDEYDLFSEELSIGLVQPVGPYTAPQHCTADGCTSESFPDAPDDTPFVRHDETCGTEPSSCYEPLATTAFGYEDIPVGTSLTTVEKSEFGESQMSKVIVRGATPEGIHVALVSTAALTTDGLSGAAELYEWSADKPYTERLQLVSLLPESEGGKPALSADLGYEGEGTRHAISDDGSRVFFTARNSSGETHLYMRDLTKRETIRVDGSGSTVPYFEAAAANGSRAIFAKGEELFECDVVELAGNLKCDLTDLTSDASTKAVEVMGGVLGAAEDLGYFYFVANGVLAPGASKGDCQPVGVIGAAVCNLYMYHDGELKFVAALSEEDAPDWGTEVGGVDLSKMTARVSRNGRWLAFMSSEQLTGYDNEDARSGVRDEEVYLYHAPTYASEKGNLVCASCDPTGARPLGAQSEDMPLATTGGQVWNRHAWIAANIPGWTNYAVARALHQSRYLTDEGRLFFNAYGPLVANDTNGVGDVYEYEPRKGEDPAGECTVAVATYSQQDGGCVRLISSPASTEESAFLDASETGADAFFLTSAALVRDDVNMVPQVYDAHVCTTEAPCFPEEVVPPPECTTTESCRGAPEPQPQIFGAPSTATLIGSGNLKLEATKPKSKEAIRRHKLSRALRLCRKAYKKSKIKRLACRKQARKKYGFKLAVEITRAGNRTRQHRR